MAQKVKIDSLLSPVQLEEFEQRALDDKQTIDSISNWLRSIGVKVSRSAVHSRRILAISQAKDPTYKMRRKIRAQVAELSHEQLHRVSAFLDGVFSGAV